MDNPLYSLYFFGDVDKQITLKKLLKIGRFSFHDGEIKMEWKLIDLSYLTKISTWKLIALSYLVKVSVMILIIQTYLTYYTFPHWYPYKSMALAVMYDYVYEFYPIIARVQTEGAIVYEYEPGFFSLLLYLFSFFVKDVAQFCYVFGTVQLLFDFGVIFYLTKIIDFLGLKIKRRLVIVYAFAPTVLVLGFARFDLMSVFFMVSAIYYYLIKRDFRVGFMLALGISFKWFPIAFLISILSLRTTEKARLVKILVSSFGLFFLMHILLFFFYSEHIFDPFIFYVKFAHTPFPDSLIGLFLVWFPSLSYMVLSLRICFGVLFLISSLWIFLKGTRNPIFRTSALIVIFILFNGYIYSPQWHIWFLPLLALNKRIDKKSIFFLEITNILVYPVFFMLALNTTGFSNVTPYDYWFVAFSIFVLLRSSVLGKILANDSLLKI